MPQLRPNSRVLILVLLITAIALIARSRQAEFRAARPRTLIVAEYRPNSEGLGDYTDLFAYRFCRGVLESRRQIFGAPLSRKDNIYYHFRYDLGRSFIHANRYAVSGTGNVVDLQTQRLLTEHGDEFVKVIPEGLLFHRDNIDIGTGYLRLDLPSGKYVFDKGLRLPSGVLSPDLGHGLLIDRTNFPYIVEVAGPNGSKHAAVRDTGRGARTFRGELLDVPIIWTSNNTFAYAKCVEQTASIFEYDIKLDRASPLGTLTGLNFSSTTDFHMDCEGSVIFQCSKGTFQLDRSARSLETYLVRPLGHEFQTPEKSQEMQPLLFLGQPIGSFHCLTYKARTSDGYLAIPYGKPASNLGYPEGFKVWSSSTKNWTTCKVPFFCDLIGWIDNEAVGTTK